MSKKYRIFALILACLLNTVQGLKETSSSVHCQIRVLNIA